jgi:TrmH family RNA methyltransferase
MISKQRIKFIKSLQYKKYRRKAQAFLIEGDKCVEELFKSDFETIILAGTTEYLNQKQKVFQSYNGTIFEVTEKELQRIGTLKTNKSVIAVARIKEDPLFVIDNEYALALDGLQDPGNLGTIIRIADWYGITKILASENTVDIYNPKVIHASMGSFTRVKIHYCDLNDFLASSSSLIKKYGTFLDGDNVHEIKIKVPAIIVIGNESNGISDELAGKIDQRISIPRIGGAESLNAAIATAIICDNMFR